MVVSLVNFDQQFLVWVSVDFGNLTDNSTIKLKLPYHLPAWL